MYLVPLNRWLLAGPWIVIITLVSVWMASMLGLFQAPNAWSYWQFHRLNLGDRPAPQVLLVEAEFEQRPESEWFELISQLEAFDPAAIGLLRQPAQLEEDSLQRLRARGAVIGQTASQAAGEHRILTLPPSQALDKLGVHQPQINDYGGRYLSTEAAVAAQAKNTEVAEKAFLIDFRPGMNYLPVIQAERVLRGDLTQSLVTGQVVLIGRSIDPTNPPLLTPLPEEAQVSRLVYAGYTVDTLLREAALRTPQWWENLLLSLAVVGTSMLLYFRLGVHHSLGIMLGGSFLLILAGWSSLYLLGLVLPLVELLALHLLLWFLLARRERQLESSTISALLRASHSRLKAHALPAEFNTSDDPWGQVLLLVTQILSLERAILLERNPVGTHVREVKAYRCSLDDVDERRRDFERTPYSTAVEERGPILLTKTYLKDPKDGCQQFLAPLEANGQLLGFISGEVAQQTLDNNPLFLSLLKDFSGHIGELLYYRRSWQVEKRRNTHPWRRLLRLDARASEYDSLQEVSRLFDQRLSLLENVFDNLHTATVLYNLFGQVTQINNKMEALVSRSGLSIFNMTAADALSSLAGMSLQVAREQLQHVMMTDETLTFSVSLPELEADYILNIQPLKSARAQRASQQNTPFQAQGFLLELTDVTFVARLEQMKDELFNKTSAELRNQLEASVLASEMLNSADVEAADKQDFTALIERKLKQMGRTLTRAQDILGEVQGINQLSSFPIRVEVLADKLVKRWKSRLMSSEVKLEFEPPVFDALVRVDLTHVERVLDAFMEVLFEDASPGTSLRFSLKEQQEESGAWSTLLFFASDGYGMPDDRLQAVLSGKQKTTSPALYRLKQASDQIDLWGGELQASTAIGKGIHFEIRLPSFSLDEKFSNNQ